MSTGARGAHTSQMPATLVEPPQANRLQASVHHGATFAGRALLLAPHGSHLLLALCTARTTWAVGRTGLAESQYAAAALTLSAALSAAASGSLPQPLLQLLSPFSSRLENLGHVGKGGFGSVIAARRCVGRCAIYVHIVRYLQPAGRSGRQAGR